MKLEFLDQIQLIYPRKAWQGRRIPGECEV